MISTSEAGAVPHSRAGAARFNVMDRFQLDTERRARELAAPTRKDQRWRFADVKRARLEGLDRWQPVALEVQGLVPGVSCLSLAQALERDEGRVRRLLENLQGPLGSEYFMAHAFLSDLLSGICLWVERDVVLDSPVILDRSYAAEGGTGSAVTLLVVENGGSISLLERFRAEAGSGGNLLAASGADVGASGRVSYTATQELPKAMNLVQCAHLDLGRDAVGEAAFFNLGASWVRQEAAALLREDGGNATLLGFNILEDSDQIDQHTRQRHSRQHGASDLLFKNAIFDAGRATFGGLIQVEEGAHFTDAYQSCRNLLLSDEAEANAMPGLEINADQVRCSHGATTGRIDGEELFYLKARGITEEVARQLITIGFAMEVVDRLSNSQVRDLLRGQVEERLRRKAAAMR